MVARAAPRRPLCALGGGCAARSGRSWRLRGRFGANPRRSAAVPTVARPGTAQQRPLRGGTGPPRRPAPRRRPPNLCLRLVVRGCFKGGLSALWGLILGECVSVPTCRRVKSCYLIFAAFTALQHLFRTPHLPSPVLVACSGYTLFRVVFWTLLLLLLSSLMSLPA